MSSVLETIIKIFPFLLAFPSQDNSMNSVPSRASSFLIVRCVFSPISTLLIDKLDFRVYQDFKTEHLPRFIVIGRGKGFKKQLPQPVTASSAFEICILLQTARLMK